MRERLRDWLDRLSWKKIATDWTVGQIASFAMSLLSAAFLTWWADPNVTRAGLVVFFLCVALAFAVLWVLFAIGWRWLYPAAASLPLAQATRQARPSAGGEKASVEFRLPSNWGPGFRSGAAEVDLGHRVQTEEIHLEVSARQRMQDVRFEVVAKERRDNQIVVLGQIGSDRFKGVVQKGEQQRFVIMRRRFWLVPTLVENPATREQPRVPIRVEKDIEFFPENPSHFLGAIGGQYYFEVSVLHDDGPDKAHFTIDTLARQDFPQSKLTNLTNIQAAMTQ